MPDAIDALYASARAEADKASRRFPQPNYTISKVAEEAGEVVKAAIHCAEGREAPAAVVSEIRQAMAMLIRLFSEGDEVHGLAPLATVGFPPPPDYADPEPMPARPADRFVTAVVVLSASVGFLAGALFVAVL